MKKLAWGVGSFVFAIGLWQAIILFTDVPPFILPSPFKVVSTLVSSRELIGYHAMITMAEVLIGLVVGSILGMMTAIHMTISGSTRRLLLPILIFFQAVPVFALAPILTLWFGYGMASKILMAVMIIYFPVVSNFLDGLDNTPTGYLDLAQTMKARPMKVLLHVRLPAALPSLGSGLRLAAVYAPIGAVIGEWVGASRGLGYLMLLANGRAKVDLMFASLFVLAVFTVVLHFLIGVLATRLTRWSEGKN